MKGNLRYLNQGQKGQFEGNCQQIIFSDKLIIFHESDSSIRINLPLFSTVVPAVLFFCPVGLSLL